MIDIFPPRASDMSAGGGDPSTDVNVIVGPMLIGLVLNMLLYGMQVMQVETYFRSNTGHPNWIRALVVFLLLADTVNSVFDVWFVYDYCVTKFGNKTAIMEATWVLSTDPVMTVISSSTVQCFYAWRVGKLTGHTWLALLIGFFSIGQFCAALSATIATAFIKEFAQFHRVKTAIIIWLVLAPITDIAISASLVRFLRGSRTGIAATDDLLGKITRVTIQTGAITAVWATVDLITFLRWTNNIHLIFNMPLAKLYSNCLMSSLNARRQWSGSSYISGDRPATGNKDVRRGIHITTTTDIDYELDTRGRSVGVVGGTNDNAIEHKPVNGGLFPRTDSGSITGVSPPDEDAEDIGALDDDLQKLGDEEAICPSAPQHIEFPSPPAAPQFRTK